MSKIPDQCIPQIQENTKISNYPIKITFLGLELSEGVDEDAHVLTALSRNPLSNPGSFLGLSHLFHMPEVGGHQRTTKAVFSTTFLSPCLVVLHFTWGCVIDYLGASHEV